MIEALAAYRAAKPLYEAEKARVEPGIYPIDRVVRLVGEVKKGDPYIAEIAMRADPWRLLAVALSKLNGVTIESIVRDSFRELDTEVIKEAASAAIKKIVAAQKEQLDGRITGKVIMELL